MPKNSESINKSLFDLLRSRGYRPTLLDTSGKEIPVPEEAEVFQFKFQKDGEEFGTVTLSIDGLHKLVVYFGDDVANSDKDTEGSDLSWYELLNHLKRFAKSNQLSFELKNKDHLKYDMAKREHMKKKEQIAEGYYPMGKSASYNDAIPTVKIVLQHTRQIQEGEQRFRNIARIFLENAEGERILAPTTRPGIAQVYARHLAEGGVPNDERWNHIKSLCEEYNKMAGFVRAVRGNQFNESAQRLVEAGLNHYEGLRETLGKMRGHRGYSAYFESWTPTLMENEGDETNLNELFVQETLDPRIESVMPILSKLSKNISEMKEVNELAEWADNLLEGGDGGEASEEPVEQLEEAPGAETLAHNEKTAKSNLDAFDLDEATDLKTIPEMDDAEKAHQKIQKPAFMRKQSGDEDWKVTHADLEKAKERNISGAEGLAALRKRMGDIEEGVAEGLDPEKKARLNDLIDAYSDATDPEYMGDDDQEDIIAQVRAEFGDRTADSIVNGPSMHFPRPGHSMGHDDLEFRQMRKNMSPNRITKLGKLHKQDSDAMKRDIKSKLDVEEDLDANQKRVGQLGPTEKVKPASGARGKLVGASESFINTDAQAVVTEMDSEGYKGHRDDEDKGKGPDKKATPAKAKDVAKDAEKELNKAMDKEHKKDVKEGQEDLDAILRIIKK